MQRRRFIIPIIVLAIIVAIVIAVLLRKAAPPEPVRLLPEAQAYVYINLKPARRADIKLPPVQLDPDYQAFVQQTGFRFEQDLDQAAVAVHVPPGTPNGENRYSEVFVGHFDFDKVRRYLYSLAKGVDSYRDFEVFNIPHENRIVRVTLLGPGMVAISNVDDPLVIRGIIDRYKRVALPFAGPPLVRQYYRKLPFATVAWAIGDIARDDQHNKAFILPGGFDLFFPPGTIAIASVRYLGNIDFKVKFVTANEDAATRVTDQLSAFLALFRTLETTASGNDPDVKAFFDSLQVERGGETVNVTAELPKGFLKKLLTEPPPTPLPPQEQPAPEKSKPPAKKPPRHNR